MQEKILLLIFVYIIPIVLGEYEYENYEYENYEYENYEYEKFSLEYESAIDISSGSAYEYEYEYEGGGLISVASSFTCDDNSNDCCNYNENNPWKEFKYIQLFKHEKSKIKETCNEKCDKNNNCNGFFKYKYTDKNKYGCIGYQNWVSGKKEGKLGAWTDFKKCEKPKATPSPTVDAEKMCKVEGREYKLYVYTSIQNDVNDVTCSGNIIEKSIHWASGSARCVYMCENNEKCKCFEDKDMGDYYECQIYDNYKTKNGNSGNIKKEKKNDYWDDKTIWIDVHDDDAEYEEYEKDTNFFHFKTYIISSKRPEEHFFPIEKMKKGSKVVTETGHDYETCKSFCRSKNDDCKAFSINKDGRCILWVESDCNKIPVTENTEFWLTFIDKEWPPTSAPTKQPTPALKAGDFQMVGKITDLYVVSNGNSQDKINDASGCKDHCNGCVMFVYNINHKTCYYFKHSTSKRSIDDNNKQVGIKLDDKLKYEYLKSAGSGSPSTNPSTGPPSSGPPASGGWTDIKNMFGQLLFIYNSNTGGFEGNCRNLCEQDTKCVAYIDNQKLKKKTCFLWYYSNTKNTFSKAENKDKQSILAFAKSSDMEEITKGKKTDPPTDPPSFAPTRDPYRVKTSAPVRSLTKPPSTQPPTDPPLGDTPTDPPLGDPPLGDTPTEEGPDIGIIVGGIVGAVALGVIGYLVYRMYSTKNKKKKRRKRKRREDLEEPILMPNSNSNSRFRTVPTIHTKIV